MKFYKSLYVSKSIANADEIIESLKHGQPIYNIYAVCVCKKTNGLMEILSTRELLKPVNVKRKYTVIALASGREDANNSAVKIIDEWYKMHGDFSGIKAYYINAYSKRH